MPSLVIDKQFSHMGGYEFISQKYRSLKNEIFDIISATIVPKKSKVSKEKDRKGQLVWSGGDFNEPFRKTFSDKDWKKLRYNDLEHGWIEADFTKKRVAVEVQFGKYFSVDTDFIRYEILHYKDLIDVGIEIIPSYELSKEFYSGVPNYNTVIARIKGRGRNNPAVPIWIIGVKVK